MNPPAGTSWTRGKTVLVLFPVLFAAAVSILPWRYEGGPERRELHCPWPDSTTSGNSLPAVGREVQVSPTAPTHSTDRSACIEILDRIEALAPKRRLEEDPKWEDLKSRWRAQGGWCILNARTLLERPDTTETKMRFLSEVLIDSGDDASLRFVSEWLKECPQGLRIPLATYYVTHVRALSSDFAAWAWTLTSGAAAGPDEREALKGLRLLGLIQGHDPRASAALVHWVLQGTAENRSAAALAALAQCPPPDRTVRFREVLAALSTDDARFPRAIAALAEARWESEAILQARRLAHDARTARTPRITSLASVGQALQLWTSGRAGPLDPSLSDAASAVSPWLTHVDSSTSADPDIAESLLQLAMAMQESAGRFDGIEIGLIAEHEPRLPSASRSAVAIGLSSRQRSPFAFDLLSHIALDDPDAEVRAVATHQVGYFQSDRVVPDLELLATSDQEPIVRRDALVGLALHRSLHADALGSDRIMRFFVKRLHSESDESVRQFLVAQVAEWGDPFRVTGMEPEGNSPDGERARADDDSDSQRQ
ncbi:MAG: HEAT repeat domain-containing protein [Planctomycetes bacterium]|nr:HEAT repeat domain-containing protein [Planctomycetota bacterium]